MGNKNTIDKQVYFRRKKYKAINSINNSKR